MISKFKWSDEKNNLNVEKSSMIMRWKMNMIFQMVFTVDFINQKYYLIKLSEKSYKQYKNLKD